MSIEARCKQYGTVFGHWKIQKLIGHGSEGKSAVFRLVRNDSKEGTSALKIVSLIEERGKYDELSSYRQKEYDRALKQCQEKAAVEVQSMRALKGNPNIVDYYGHEFRNWSDSSGFGCDLLIHMELLEDLRQFMQSDLYFTERQIVKVGCEICAALVLCHNNRIIHRDIKPENIMVNKKGTYKLGDFGISRILDASPTAMASTSIGTLAYAAPEQILSRHNERVDIYSLGLVLYELINKNRLPFSDSPYISMDQIKKRLDGRPIPKPDECSAGLWNVIRNACAHNVTERYQTAQEFLDELCRLDKTVTAYDTLPALSELGLDGENDINHDRRTEPPVKLPEKGNSTPKNPKRSPKVKIAAIASVLLLFICLGIGFFAYQMSIESIMADYTGGMLFVGDRLDYGDLSVTGIRRNGKSVAINEFTVTPSEFTDDGVNQITITAKGEECTLEVPVYQIDHLTAVYGDELIPFGGALDVSKIVVTGFCTDGTELILHDYEVDLSQELLPGSNQIRIAYDGLEAILGVNVEKPAIKISFDPKGGACSESERTLVYGDLIGGLPIVENRQGYTFGGWTYNNEVISEDFVINETEDIILTASWMPNVYTVTYHSDGESYTQDFMYGQEQQLTANQFAKPIMRFAGWAVASGSDQVEYKNNERVSDLISENNGNLDLYAVWVLDKSLLLDDLVNDSGTTTVYKAATSGFSMFGTTYTGFTVKIGAWLNLWNSGTQYCVFDIADWSEVGDTLHLKFGHVDGSENAKVKISIYFDGSDDAAYVFTYDSSNPPKTEKIDIGSHESMKIIVDNLSQTITYAGFSFESIT